MEQASEIWTPQQQQQELKKRLTCLKSLMTPPVSFKPNPDDLVVAVPPKNGTTWLLHICHQIRVKGQEPDFEDQMGVITLIEATKELYSCSPEEQHQPASPRIYGTHLPYPLVPTEGKRIFCFRNQRDVVMSSYHFLNNLLLLKGRVSLPIFAQEYLQRIENNINDLLMWWEHRNDKDMLLLFFDDLKEDHAGSVHQIAKHMGVNCTEDEIARVVHTTSHAEMSRHAAKFSAHKNTLKLSKMIGEKPLTECEMISKVRKDGGKSGEGKQQLPVEIQQKIDELWQAIVTSKLGFQNLDEMRAAWKMEQLH